ncbi:hypothetical protein CONLIGDRAFT_683399 [Coniochaeta ligniaria NRRL 30616]|uniref:Ribosome assembly protein 3 n=1 Tax=Coniochaeta ligniaria NRRL 30616 TaxID=1408157 RepID=A0A1J7J9E5_9PEZI|nr:hypothetical protein CONLIGDRAFT_683399 [Coniochaeta ligniaria NRRL 30616]
MSSKTDSDIAAEFQAYYLQRATKELAEDLDKQGTSMFSAEDKRRIVADSKKDAEDGN